MGRITRRRRASCELACEIVLARGRRARGRIVAISEGGLALVTDVAFEQGDPLRLLIKPSDFQKALCVSAIVWNDRSAVGAANSASRRRRLGCVVSEPSREFLEVLERLDPQPIQPETIPIAKPQAREPSSDWAEPDLPRSREIQPPPKPEPEESLPYFRVRMKQIGGPRTRILTLRARSATQAECLALEELAEISTDSAGWGVLHIARVSGGRQ